MVLALFSLGESLKSCCSLSSVYICFVYACRGWLGADEEAAHDTGEGRSSSGHNENGKTDLKWDDDDNEDRKGWRIPQNEIEYCRCCCCCCYCYLVQNRWKDLLISLNDVYQKEWRRERVSLF